MNTHENYVSLELAKLLKKAGFDWETKCIYNPIGEFCKLTDGWSWNNRDDAASVSAPTLAVAQRWLREIKNIRLFVESGNEYYTVESYIYYKNCWRPTGICHNELEYERFNTHEEALEAGIKKCIKEDHITNKCSEE